MKASFRLCFFLILLLTAQAISGQQMPLDFNLVKSYNGITLGKINCITQDRSGYMWFANSGNNCITRFDGYKMISYKYDPSDSNSLDNRTGIECIAADSSGSIWINAARGIDKFDPATGKFIHFRYPPNEIRGINAILVDHLGVVWLGTDQGLDRLDQNTGKFIHHTRKENDNTSLSCDTVRCLYEDRHGVLWVGTGWEFAARIKEGGLNRFNRETETFTRYIHDPNDPHSLSGNKVKAIFEDSRGVFWVGTDSDGLHIMDRKTGTFERLTYDPLHPEKLSRPPVQTGKDYADHITFIKEDGAGAIWIGTYYAGVLRYDPITKETTHFDSKDKSRQNGFTDDQTWCAYTSRDGTFWISTEKSENQAPNLFRIDPLQTGFTSVNMGGQVHQVYEDSSGKIWMCTGKGLLRIAPGKNEKKYFIHDPSDPYSISSNGVNFIKPDHDRFLWVGTMNGLNHFDSETGRFTKYMYDQVSKGDFVDTAVWGLLKGDDGKIYVTTFLGFYIMNPGTGLMKRYENDVADTGSISANFTTGICKDKSGNIWIGTWSTKGLNLLDIKTGKFKHYLDGMNTSFIYKDSSGIIWVGTDNGLYYRNDSADTFLPVSAGGIEFRTAFIKPCWEDEDKNLWGTSSLGVFRLNPIKNELCIYGERFGIISDHRSNLSKIGDGRFFLSSEKGYYTFIPGNLVNHASPQLILTDFKIKGSSIAPGKEAPYKGSIEEAREIELQYKQSSFTVDFAAIHYSNPQNNIRYFMLQGYDSSWIKADSSNSAAYRDIPTGEYLFRIKASSSYGVWSETGVKIIISPPWWFTWWAITLEALVLLLAIWGIIKWRTKALEKEKIVLEKKVAERTLELKEEKEIVEQTLTELKSTQAQLIQSEKMASLGELTAGIAHEIQNPLNFVNNFSDVNKELVDEMQDEMDKGNMVDAKAISNEIKENEEKINHHGKRAEAIVKGMLQHSRASTGKKEPADINALADEYLRLAYHGIRAKDKEFNSMIETEFDATIGKISIMPQEFGRVLLNLINNAFYAVSEKRKSILHDTAAKEYAPTVSLVTKKIGDKVEITVRDNGMGIPDKIRDKIFQPFFTTKPTGQGTGLGLSVAYDIIKAHNGEIRLETKEGEGAAFIIQLPAK